VTVYGILMGMDTDAMLQPDPTLLPDDPALLKALVMQLLEQLQSANAGLERQEHHMHLLLKRLCPFRNPHPCQQCQCPGGSSIETRCFGKCTTDRREDTAIAGWANPILCCGTSSAKPGADTG
jgi:hypothetical protein